VVWPCQHAITSESGKQLIQALLRDLAPMLAQ
jgi:hypothetical protein